MLKIRLARTGKKGQPSYRVVIKLDRSKRNGEYVDIIGWYNPLDKKNPQFIDMEKYAKWIANGAQPTESVQRLVLTKEEKIALWPDKPKQVKKQTEK